MENITQRTALAALACALAACGGGSGGAAPAAAPAAQIPSGQMAPLFAAATGGAVGPAAVTLKACLFQARQVGKEGESGQNFLDGLVVETLPSATAPLYDALTGMVAETTRRAFKGSNGKVGAPPVLYSGVAGKTAAGYVGFGAPCGPTSMVKQPAGTCYWLVDRLNGFDHVATAYIQVGGARPESGTGGVSLSNPGWSAGEAFMFWYESGPGADCSAPGSATIWRNKG